MVKEGGFFVPESGARIIRISEKRDGYVTHENGDSESAVTGVTPFEDIKIRGVGVVMLVADYIKQFVDCTDDQALACSLWTIHTHCIDAAYYTPYLNINSAQRQSGKTTLYDVLRLLAYNPMDTAHVTAAGLRRSFVETRTLFWDEVDNVFKKRDEDTSDLKAVLNSGFKRGAKVFVNVRSRNDWNLKEFNVFSAKVLCGIGGLPDTLASRSIPITLQRMSKSDKRRRFEEGRELETAAAITGGIERWAKDAVGLLKDIDPEAPEMLDGRQADVWRPLFAIADLIGWGERVREAAVRLHENKSVESKEVTLLRDIMHIFGSGQEDMWSQELCDALCDIETSPWITAGAGNKPLKPHELAALLKPFGIEPKRIRIQDGEDVRQRRGYTLDQFIDIWARYL